MGRVEDQSMAVLPGATVDLRLFKRIKLMGPLALDFIVEAFNLFDRTDFSEVNDTPCASGFRTRAIFGTGAFPTNPLPLYGRYEQDLGPARSSSQRSSASREPRCAKIERCEA